MLELVFALVFGILAPTGFLVAITTLGFFVWAKLRGLEFEWSRCVDTIVAAGRLQLAFFIVGTPAMAITLGQATGFGFIPLVILLTILVGVAGFVVFMFRGIPHWCTWPVWRRALAWPFTQK